MKNDDKPLVDREMVRVRFRQEAWHFVGRRTVGNPNPEQVMYQPGDEGMVEWDLISTASMEPADKHDAYAAEAFAAAQERNAEKRRALEAARFRLTPEGQAQLTAQALAAALGQQKRGPGRPPKSECADAPDGV